MDEFGIIIVVIIIGVLITRTIVGWMEVFKKYAESVIDVDMDQSDNDFIHFKQLVVSTFVGTLITATIIYVIIVTVPIEDKLDKLE